ncbi:DNA-binding MarR family transcriptional regulator [Kineococcus xinjiangensis]|uniref:DNA-binding MarR family transcriptional regulator n=1 Tax=Kineococcus xinjiangensis TaxID=512762 RepID=A0A2S6II79_9ACTN|nr:MarR family transcriptional regulator [Kineococcus xinjiangensis]PPK93880.1 DNA-binding MarR family transcriptional regulator [Kineococcus xinjiangensis]
MTLLPPTVLRAALPGAASEEEAVALAPSSGLELGYLTIQAGLAVGSAIDAAAAELGVVGSDLRALYGLAVHGTLPAGALAQVLALQQSTVTLISDRLESGGLLLRERDPADRRRVLLRPTPAGEALLAQAAARVRVELQELFAPLSPAAAASLAALLGEVVEPWLLQRLPGRTAA